MTKSTQDTQELEQLEHVKNLLSLSMVREAQSFLDISKLPYVIEGGQLKTLLRGTALHLSYFITKHPQLVKLKDDIHKLANCEYEVLIVGETGTGKEIIARSLIGDRKGNFKVVNCGGMPEHLVESELFGHVSGAFTGAVRGKVGMMKAADDGVFFLDEVGELPLPAQAKLLRAIQEKKIRPVGGVEELEISCKIVCATHRDLKKMVSEGLFRQDLYARVSTFVVNVPPLRDREMDYEPIIMKMQGGPAFLSALAVAKIPIHKLDVEHNVRSLRQHVVRFSVLGQLPQTNK